MRVVYNYLSVNYIVDTAGKINNTIFVPTPSKFVCGFCPYNRMFDAATLS